MQTHYTKLADILDEMPNGYPKTKSGVELKLLAKLFTPQHAELACHLSTEPQSAKVIAASINGNEKETLRSLIEMTKKGLIKLKRQQGEMQFQLIPFIVGIYEYQNAQIDKEFAELFEQYYKEAFHKMTMIEPSVHRVIPVEKTIPVDIDVMPYEKASNYLKGAKSWGVLDCICRVQQRLIGKGCSHSIENCLVFSSRENAYDKVDSIKSITIDEALEVLRKAHEEGLVHSTGNSQEDIYYICNCCTCSCGILRSIVEYGNISSIAGSDFYAEVNPDLCSGCEICIDRCQFNALDVINGISNIKIESCYGCGLCITACPEGALSLKQKDNIKQPPATEQDWRSIRSKARNM